MESRFSASCVALMLPWAVLAGCSQAAPDTEVTQAQAFPLSANQSKLWGADGELFDAKGRLPDWSYAGYHAAEREIPKRMPTINVRDRGAKGDGSTNDTAALVAVVTGAKSGDVVYLPAGTYVLKQELKIPSGVVLQGDGPDKTILSVPVNLTDLHGNPGLAANDNSSYSFSQGFLYAEGKDAGALVGRVTKQAKRGDKSVSVSSTQGLAAGQWIHIDQTDVQGKLINELYVDAMPSGADSYGKVVDLYNRITAVTADRIDLERALPLDVDLAFNPRVFASAPTVSEVGIEHLSVRFPQTTYPGHFNELGYNAFYFKGVFNSWMDDVKVVNGDYGMNLIECQFVTVRGAVVDSSNGRTGHHALNNTDGNDNLFEDFDVRVQFVHDLTSEWYSTGIVYSRGKGVNLCLDHHKAAPYGTLWTELNLGSGKRPWTSGGRDDRGAQTGAYDTMWNIKSSQNLAMPPSDYGPKMNFVGFQTGASSASSPYDWWFEKITNVDPPNLYEAMKKKRLATLPPALEGGAGAGGASGMGGASNDSGGASAGGATVTETGGSAAATAAGTANDVGGGATTGGSVSSSAGIVSVAGSGAAPTVSNPASLDSSGCSCNLGQRSSGSGAALGLVLGAALLWRRRACRGAALALGFLAAACGGDGAAPGPIGSNAGSGGVATGAAGSAQAGANTGGTDVAGQTSGGGAGAPSSAGQGGNGGSMETGGAGGSVAGVSGMGGSATAGAGGMSGGAGIDYPKQADVLEVLARVNQQFVKKWPDPGKMLDASHPSNIWTRAVYYEGLMALNEVSPKAEYKKYAVDWGTSHNWGLRAPVTHADNQCAGQTYYDLYKLDGAMDAVRLNAIRDSVDSMVASASSANWTWIDAIQMSMPVFIRFGALTNQDKYYAKAYSLYRHSKVTEGGGLYDTATHLWWRDAKWKPDQKKTPSGKNIYWSRGNGWVFAALARVLGMLPASQTNRAEYEKDFQDMAEALRAIQRADGLWNPSLGDPEHYGGPEMSGTSLFTYGMAWGVRTGLLDAKTYGPVVVKAWNGLVNTSVHTDGFLGYAQSTGDAPDDGQPLSYDKVPDFEDFGVGCFLLGGSEVAKLGR